MYLATGTSVWDPMMVWGTTVETEPLEVFLGEQRRRTGQIVSPAHVLVCAVAKSLCEHPKLNRRVYGRRVYQYDGVNIIMPMMATRAGVADTIFLRRADEMSLSDIAQRFWTAAREKSMQAVESERRTREGGVLAKAWAALKQRLRLRWILAASRPGCVLANWRRLPTVWRFQQEFNGANAFVNYLGFPGAPPMLAFKPSCLPMNAYSVNVTMGPSEPRPVVVDQAVVIRKLAPLFIRADHRMVNAFEAAAFIRTLRSYLTEPWLLTNADIQDEPAASPRNQPSTSSERHVRLAMNE
jgi:hypothetical protein